MELGTKEPQTDSAEEEGSCHVVRSSLHASSVLPSSLLASSLSSSVSGRAVRGTLCWLYEDQSIRDLIRAQRAHFTTSPKSQQIKCLFANVAHTDRHYMSVCQSICICLFVYLVSYLHTSYQSLPLSLDAYLRRTVCFAVCWPVWLSLSLSVCPVSS
jgi:hypothetical protein